MEKHVAKGRFMKSNLRIYYLMTLCCFTIGATNHLQGAVLAVASPASGTWVNGTGGGNWDDSTNWVTFPTGSGEFPNGTTGMVASFWGLPNSDLTISANGSTSITIGKLRLGTPNLSIQFPLSTPLKFKDPNGASIFVSATSSIDTPIEIDSDLQIFTDFGPDLTISEPITTTAFPLPNVSYTGRSEGGAGSLFYSMNGPNTYGNTIVNNGFLKLNGLTGSVLIPNTLTINKGEVQAISSNVFAHTAVVEVIGKNDSGLNSKLLLSSSNNSQTFDSLIVNNGSVADSFSNSFLTLNNNSGAILISNNGSISVKTIMLHNGGGITFVPYFGTGSPQAIFNGVTVGGMTINLLNHTVPVTVSPSSSPELTFVDLIFDDVVIQNGSLNKLGEGIVGFFNRGGGIARIPSLTINEGVVLIGSSSGEIIGATNGNITVDVNIPGALTGFGQLGNINTATVNNNSIVLPGDPVNIGTLTIFGQYNQSSSGTLFIKGRNPTNHDSLVVVNQNVTLDGELFFLGLQDPTSFMAGDIITIIDNSGGTGITGNFKQIISEIPPHLDIRFEIDPSGSVGRLVFFELPELFCPIPILSLENYINMSLPIFAIQNAHALQLCDRMRSVRERMKICSYCVETVSEKESCSNDGSRLRNNGISQPFSIYISPLGSFGEVKRISNQNGFDFNSEGFLLGSDYASYKVGFGAQLGYENLNGDVDNYWGEFDVQTLFGKLYGTFAPFCNSGVFLDLAAGASGNWYDIERNIGDLTAEGEPRGWSWDAYAGLGFDTYADNFGARFSPLASIHYVYLHIDDYSEQGADGLDARVGRQNIQSIRSWLGASIGNEFCQGCTVWMPEIRGYWQHEFGKINQTIDVAPTTSFSGTSRLQLFGGNRDYGSLGAELRVLFGKNWTLAFSYDYNWNNALRANLFYGEIGVNF